MIKNIKRVGIIFLAVAIICLMAIGCLSVNSVANNGSNVGVLSSEKSNSASGDINSNNDSTIYTNGKNNVVPSAEKEYTLTCDCPHGEPCVCDGMAEIWDEAQQYSIDKGVRVKITLGKDWIAKESENSRIFGNADIFPLGAIEVLRGSEIIVDLNGYTIDRKLTQAVNGGYVFAIRETGKMILYDNQYDKELVEQACEDFKNNASSDKTINEVLMDLPMGKITGGWSTGDGGAILVSNINYLEPIVGDEGKFDMYGGLIVANKAVLGAGVFSNCGIINLYSGAIMGNTARLEGGGIRVFSSQLNMSNMLVGFNTSGDRSGGIHILSSTAEINSCSIFNNTTNSHAGGIMVKNISSSAVINNCNIYENSTTIAAAGGSAIVAADGRVDLYNNNIYSNDGKSGTIYSMTSNSLINFNSGKVYNNIAKDGGVFFVGSGVLNVQGGEFYGNEITGQGSFLYVANNGISNMYKAIIHDNATTSSTFNHTTINFEITAKLNIGAGIVSYNNTNITNNSADLYIKNGQTIGILERMLSGNSVTRISIAKDDGKAFTSGWSNYNGSINPDLIFYAPYVNKAMKLIDGEVAINGDSTMASAKIDWIYGTGANDKTQDYEITLPYKGSNYIIRSSVGEFYRYGVGNNTSFEIKNAGRYVFAIKNSTSTAVTYINPTITIIIEPKVVDLEWDKELTYSGVNQMPTAIVKENQLFENDTCIVKVTGGAINVGAGYYATANSISNSNYVISSSTKNSYFEIVPTTLNVTIKTNNKSVYFNGNKVDLKNEWFTMTHDAVGVDSAKNINSLFKIDYNAFIPQFHNGTELLDSVTNVGEYTIHSTPLNIEEVFTGNRNYNVNINYVNTGKLTINNPAVVRASAESGYDFMILQNNKRVSYKEKELIHGDNDSEYTNFVLGNIAPNTSVQTLLNNLVFSDMSQVQIYNGANEVVYGENAKAFYTANIENGTELAVGTGWYIRYEKLTGGEETIYLSVLGDLTGDGKVNSADVNRLRQMVNKSEVYTNSNEVVKLSSLIINNGKTPTNADAEIVWNVVCGKIDIADFI